MPDENEDFELPSESPDRPDRPDAPRAASSGLERPLTTEAMPHSVTCPFCDSPDTEQFSAFGSALSVSQYYCRACHTVFEWMKWRKGG